MRRSEEEALDTYLIVRRRAWRATALADEAVGRARLEAERLHGVVAWTRSYVLEETDGTIGFVCVYEAVSPEAIRHHAAEAGLPIDEIVLVADTVIVREDVVPAETERRNT